MWTLWSVISHNSYIKYLRKQTYKAISMSDMYYNDENLE